MPSKFIEVVFDDGIYHIPAEVIAVDRASYYAKSDTESGYIYGDDQEEYKKVYDVEYNITLNDDYELMDWLRNNMNWKQLEPYASKVSERGNSPSHKTQWRDEVTEGRIKIVER